MRPVRFAPSLALVLALAAGAAFVRADGTPQALPFSQAWTTPTLITANDNWTGVPAIDGDPFLTLNVPALRPGDMTSPRLE